MGMSFELSMGTTNSLRLKIRMIAPVPLKRMTLAIQVPCLKAIPFKRSKRRIPTIPDHQLGDWPEDTLSCTGSS